MSPGSPVFQMVDLNQIWVAAWIEQALVAQLREGQKAAIKLRSSRVFQGEVARLNKEADTVTRELEVDVKFAALPDPLVIGEEAEVEIETGRQTATGDPVICRDSPRTAIQASWWRIKGLVRFQKVSLGLHDGQKSAVLEGLAEGELVVINPAGIDAGPENPPGSQASRPEGLMDLAVYDLKLHKGRFIATIIGVGLLFTIVLAMNGLYRGNIHEGLATIQATNPDLWVVERYRGGPFNETSTMPEFYHYSVKADTRRREGQPLYFLYRGKADPRRKPPFQHHRLRGLRRPGGAAKDPCRQEYRAGSLRDGGPGETRGPPGR